MRWPDSFATPKPDHTTVAPGAMVGVRGYFDRSALNSQFMLGNVPELSCRCRPCRHHLLHRESSKQTHREQTWRGLRSDEASNAVFSRRCWPRSSRSSGRIAWLGCCGWSWRESSRIEFGKLAHSDFSQPTLSVQIFPLQSKILNWKSLAKNTTRFLDVMALSRT
jgi:hypothetical protein